MFYRSYHKAKNEKSDTDYSYVARVINCETGLTKKTFIPTFANYYANSDFNKAIIIGNEIVECSNMFADSLFNCNVLMSGNVENCQGMFKNTPFNKPITLPNTVKNCANMFNNSAFNQNIYIPKSVTSVVRMFSNCNQLQANIYFNGNPSTTSYIFANRTNSKRINLFCSSLTNAQLNSLYGTNCKWTEMTNGWYNSVANIYIYNNYVGT